MILLEHLANELLEQGIPEPTDEQIEQWFTTNTQE